MAQTAIKVMLQSGMIITGKCDDELLDNARLEENEGGDPWILVQDGAYFYKIRFADVSAVCTW